MATVPEEPKWSPRFPFAKLTDPQRVATVLQHRDELGGVVPSLERNNMTPRKVARNESVNYDPVNPAGVTDLPKHFKGLRPIRIRDMDPWECTYWTGYKIELEIVEDVQSFTRGMLLGQDRSGDVVFVALYNDTPSVRDDRLQEKLGFGTRITIAQPYMKIALDGRTMIRIEDDESLHIHSDKDLKKCRFCSKANCVKTCGRCKRSYYCSKECQAQDWKVLKHKLVCNAYKFVSTAKPMVISSISIS